MKIAVIGGGSSYTPELIEGLILRSKILPITEVAMVDVPEGQEKLNIIYDLTLRMFKKANLPVKVTATLNRREALEGCSYVITQLRVGRMEARAKDEGIPLKYNHLGQETTGAGGFAKALRTIPVVLSIARDMEELCPDAWLINFTNPSGIVTEAVRTHSSIRCIGLCNAPTGLYRGLSRHLNVGMDDLYIQYIGLNHLSWAKKIFVKGEDKTDELFGDEKFVEYVSHMLSSQPGAKELISILKMIPSYYYNYFYFEKQAVEKEIESVKNGTGTRANQVMAVEKELFELYKQPELQEKPAQLSQRGGAYYSDAALSLIESIHTNDGRMHIVNVMNQGAISDLPYDGVIETNCLVNSAGAHPIASGKLPEGVAAIIKAVKTYEQLTVKAAVTGCRQTALLALLSNPLIHGADNALHLLNDLLDAHKAYLPKFFPEEGK
jgi:6-phospho-beta-glucosidase